MGRNLTYCQSDLPVSYVFNLVLSRELVACPNSNVCVSVGLCSPVVASFFRVKRRSFAPKMVTDAFVMCDGDQFRSRDKEMAIHRAHDIQKSMPTPGLHACC